MVSLCALSGDEILLAMGAAGLRALSLRTELLAAHQATAQRYNVRRVAFDAHTDTLLLVVNERHLLSLRCYGSEWREVQRLASLIPTGYYYIAVCDSRLLLFARKTITVGTLYVFEVSKNHSLHDAGTVQLHSTAIYDLACTRRGNDTLVAGFSQIGLR